MTSEVSQPVYNNNIKGFSIGQSQRSDYFDLKSKNEKIDPALYEPRDDLTVNLPQEWSIGNLEKDTLKYFNYYKKDVPGPGTYKPEDSEKVLQKSGQYHKFGIKLEDKPPDFIDFPAPNKYDQSKQSNNSYQYSFRDRYDDQNNYLQQKKDQIPGPTHYYLEGDRKQFNALNIYKAPKTENWKHNTIYNNKNPGPGQYKEVKDTNKSCQWNFSKAHRFQSNSPTSKKLIPGPGMYDIPIKVPDKNLSKSISPPHQEQPEKQSKLPGPAQYFYEKSLEKVLKRSPQQKINQAPRSQSPQRKFRQFKEVGPGKYSPNFSNRPISKAIKFGIAERVTEKKENDFPGPGKYDLKQKTLEGFKYSIKGKNPVIMNDSQAITYPAPNYYEPQNKVIQKQGPSYKFGSQQKFSQSPKHIPGPNEYNKEYQVKQSPKFSFGKSIRFNNTITKDDPYALFL